MATEHWKELIPRLLTSHPVLEIGSHEGDPLEIDSTDYLDLRGKTSVHQLASLLKRSLIYLGCDSGPLHVAACWSLPSVCILGGRIPPIAIQYPNVHSIVNRPSCADCWNTGPCKHDLKCMRALTPDPVYRETMDAIRRCRTRP